MEILNTLKSILGGSSKNQSEIVSVIMNLIGGQSGGLNGFLNQFSSKGLGDVASSWVGAGKNLPVSPDQIRNVLGDDTISSITSKLGLDKNTVTKQLSNMLPRVVDKLTPEGKVPQGDILTQGRDLLSGLLGKK